MNQITMKLQADHLILEALKEDISSEDVTTNSVMKEAVAGEVDLICKQDGIIAGLEVFERVFALLDPDTKVELYCKDGEEVKNGQLMGKVKGDIRVLLSGERVALELSSENERNRDLYQFCCKTSGRKQDQTPRYKKNNTEYAYF